MGEAGLSFLWTAKGKSSCGITLKFPLYYIYLIFLYRPGVFENLFYPSLYVPVICCVELCITGDLTLKTALPRLPHQLPSTQGEATDGGWEGEGNQGASFPLCLGRCWQGLPGFCGSSSHRTDLPSS